MQWILGCYFLQPKIERVKMGHDVQDLPFILKWLSLSWTTFAAQGLGQKPPEKVQDYFTASILLGGRSWWQNGYLFGISTSTPH